MHLICFGVQNLISRRPKIRLLSFNVMETLQRDQLITLATRLGYAVRIEIFDAEAAYRCRSGQVQLHHRKLILLDHNATVAEQIRSLTEILCQEDLETIFIPPLVRELLLGNPGE